MAEYLQDILSMIDHVENFARGINFEQFCQDAKTQFAVVHAIEVIGEAAMQMPTSARTKYGDIPWKDITGMRNRLIHGYFGVDLKIAWDTARISVPQPKPLIEAALAEERRG